MNKTLRIVVPGVAAAAMAVSLTACGSSSPSSSSSTPAAGGSSAATSSSGTLSVGGSSAQKVAQGQWITDFQKANSGVTINYNPVGSGAGRTSFYAGQYPFAASDSFINPTKKPADYASAKAACQGADPIEVPVYVSPIAVVFNLKGVSSLNLDAATIAKIFSGKITKWNDPAIAALNSGTTLPSTAIQPVHRSDASGTTNNFTDYLVKAAGSAWNYAAADTFPISSGLSGKGTSGVVTTTQGTDGAIAYVDASQAGGFGVVNVKVAGSYVTPSATAAAADLADSKLSSVAKTGQLVYTVDRTPTSTSDYPILLVSYIIACPSYKDASTAALVKNYLSFILTDAEQAAAANAAGSAAVPSSIAAQAAKIVAGIK